MIRKKAKGKKKDKRGGIKREVYNVPDQIDIDIKHQDYLKHSKGLDENGRPKPLTENQLKALIRSAVRKKWMFAPQKLAFIESRREPNLDPNSRTLWHWKCDMCLEYFPQGEFDVDHKQGENSYTSLGDTFKWASSILDVGGETDLSILCSDKCHPIKTVMESHNLNYEDAVTFKKMTAWEDSNKIPKQKSFLMKHGYSEDQVSNSTKRRQCYMEYLNSLK